MDGSEADTIFPIGKLSMLTGVTIETIRYYERIGLLAAPQRTASGRRVFDRDDLRVLVFIRRARELGFALEEIRELLRLADKNGSCRQGRDVTLPRLADIRSKLRDLRKIEETLAATLARCSGQDVPECAILDTLDIERMSDERPVSALARGS